MSEVNLMRELKNVIGVEVLHDYVVQLTFSDGIVREIDLEPLLYGPIFEPIQADMDLFRSVQVDEDAGTIVWPNGADIDPNVLYDDDLIPAWMEEPETINAN